jgi:hypothetical protein
MTGWQDLQDKMLGLNWGLFGQDGRIYRIDCFKLTMALTMTLVSGLQVLQD